jgi:hypothetical protein
MRFTKMKKEEEKREIRIAEISSKSEDKQSGFVAYVTLSASPSVHLPFTST